MINNFSVIDFCQSHIKSIHEFGLKRHYHMKTGESIARAAWEFYQGMSRMFHEPEACSQEFFEFNAARAFGFPAKPLSAVVSLELSQALRAENYPQPTPCWGQIWYDEEGDPAVLGRSMKLGDEEIFEGQYHNRPSWFYPANFVSMVYSPPAIEIFAEISLIVEHEQRGVIFSRIFTNTYEELGNGAAREWLQFQPKIKYPS